MTTKPMKCPECGGKEIDSLASSESTLRYQCKSIKCSHQWTLPRERGLSAIREAMDRRKEEVTVADLMCGKCGKPYKHQKRLETHEASCSGEKPAKAPKERKPRTMKTRLERPVGGKTASSLTENFLAMLQDKRTERLAALTAGDDQLQEIDRLIAKIGGAKG